MRIHPVKGGLRIVVTAVAAVAALAAPGTAAVAAAHVTAAAARSQLPVAASWTSAQRGVVLAYPSLNPGTKPSLLETTNGGRTWQSLTAPPLKYPQDGQPDLVGADGVIAVTDGTHIVATRDSGKHWTAERIAGVSGFRRVYQLATVNGRVLAIVTTGKLGALFSGTAQSGVLRAVKGLSIRGGEAYGSISTADGLQVDLGSNFTAEKYWVSRNGTSFTVAPLPCQATTIALLGGVKSGNVIASCNGGPSAVGPGTTDAQLKIASRLGGKFRSAGKLIALPNIQAFAAASPSTAVLGTEGGLFRTASAGKRWTFALPLPNSGTVSDLSFVTAATGFAVTSTTSNTGKKVNTVYRTADGGAKWSAISVP